MATTDDGNLPIICCLLLLLGHVNTSAAGDRGRRSDDSDPLEAVVSALSQKVEQLTAQLTALDARLVSQDTEITSLQANLSRLTG